MTAPPIPEARVYRHLGCGNETVICGQAFEVASNPMSDMTRTWCNTCNAFFPIAEIEWSDSGEKISDYYARHNAKVTRFERFLCSKKFMIVCAVAGVILGGTGGYFLFRSQQLWLQIFMVPFCGVLGVFATCGAYVALGHVITRRVCGAGDTRVLT